MDEFKRLLLQYEQQKKTNELVDSQYRNDPCENDWMQSFCVISYADCYNGELAELYAEDLTYAYEFNYELAVKHLEEYYFTLV